MIPVLPDDIAAEFPFEPHWVNVAGHDLHYVDEGPRSDAAVVLLHGNPTWSFLYRRIIPLVTDAGWRVVAPDYLGSGRSDHGTVSSQYSISHHIGRTLAVLAHADVRRAVFFLQDWGGPIGMGCGMAVEGLFRGAALGNTFWGRASSFHERVFPWRALHGPVAGPLLFGRRSVFIEGAARGMPPDLSEVARRAYRLPWEVHGGPGATLPWPRAISLGPEHPTDPLAAALWDWMRRADVPVRWVWGAGDVVFPPGEQYEAMADRFPRGRQHAPVLVDDGGHFVQEFAPEAIAAAVVACAEEGLKDPAAPAAPVLDEPVVSLVAPLTVLVDDGVTDVWAAGVDALGEEWLAPSGRRYRLVRRDSRLEVQLLVPSDWLVAHPLGEEVDGDLLAMAAEVGDRLGGDWTADAVRNASRVWGGWPV